jgi:hypothetical protein
MSCAAFPSRTVVIKDMQIEIVENMPASAGGTRNCASRYSTPTSLSEGSRWQGANAGLEVAQGLSLAGSVEVSVCGDFNTAGTGDSKLPRVRRDFLKFFTAGKTGIGHLEAD